MAKRPNVFSYTSLSLAARKLILPALWAGAGALLLALAYAVYVETGDPAAYAMRARGCVLCHSGEAELLPCLRSLQPGDSPREALLARLREVHPTLSRGVEEELADYVAAQQLPALAKLRAGAPGKALYMAKCAACHGAGGEGQPGEYPPLLGSEWLVQQPDRLPEILTEGLRERIEVKGEVWDKTMRAPGLASPQEVQQVADFVRREFAR